MAGKMNGEKKKKTKKKDGMKNKVGRLGRCLKVPFRVLSKALDFYVRSITYCSGRARCGSSSVHGLPRNLSAGSSESTVQHTNEDFQELLRAAFTRILRDNNEIPAEVPRDHPYSYCSNNGKAARSCASGMGSIDEDRPCEFGEEVRVDVSFNVLYPRSRSRSRRRDRSTGRLIP